MTKFTIKQNLIFFVLALTIPLLGLGGYLLNDVWASLKAVEKRQHGQALIEATWPVLIAKVKGAPQGQIPSINSSAYPGFSACFTEAGAVRKKVDVNGEKVTKIVDVKPIEAISTGQITSFMQCVGETAHLLQITDRGQLFLTEQTISQLPIVADRLSRVMGSARGFEKQKELGGPAKMFLYVNAGGYKSVADDVSRLIRTYDALGLTPEENVIELSTKFGGLNNQLQGGLVGYGKQLEKATSGAELDRTKLENTFSNYTVIIDDLWQNFSKMLNEQRAVDISNLQKNAMALMAGLIFITALSIGIAILVYATIMNKISSLNKNIRAMMNENDKDSLMAELPQASANDEIGRIAQAVGFFRDSVVERMKRDEKITRSEAGIARKKEIDAIVEDFQEKTSSLLEATETSIKEMEETSNILHDAAQDTSGLVSTVSAASTESSKSVQTVANAAEEMVASIRAISDQATEVTDIVKSASSQAITTNADIEALSKSASSISEIVSLIQAIAEQTNLLALNATIEAARAGEAGKGFAIVAGEVKALASQTATATERISNGVTDIQSYTSRVVEAMETITTTMETAKSRAEGITNVLEKQRQTTNEINRSSGIAYKGTEEVSTHIQTVGTAAERTNAAADTVRAVSNDVAKRTTALRDEVDFFLQRVGSI